jgi:hypothetical protein
MRFKQQAAKNLLNEPVSRACLDRVDATVSVRMLIISTIQHFCLELLIFVMRAPRFVKVADAVDVAVDVVLDKAPPRMVAISVVVWNVATFKTALFAPVLASWCWRNGPAVGRGNAKALRLSASTRPSEVTTRQKRRTLILSGRRRYV